MSENDISLSKTPMDFCTLILKYLDILTSPLSHTVHRTAISMWFLNLWDILADQWTHRRSSTYVYYIYTTWTKPLIVKVFGFPCFCWNFVTSAMKLFLTVHALDEVLSTHFPGPWLTTMSTQLDLLIACCQLLGVEEKGQSLMGLHLYQWQVNEALA